MPQRNDIVSVKANGRVIDVPQSYVDRFPDLYEPIKLNKDGAIPANVKDVEDARGKSLPPFATTPADLPATGGTTTGTTATSTDAATTTGSRAAAATTEGTAA